MPYQYPRSPTYDIGSAPVDDTRAAQLGALSNMGNRQPLIGAASYFPPGESAAPTRGSVAIPGAEQEIESRNVDAAASVPGSSRPIGVPSPGVVRPPKLRSGGASRRLGRRGAGGGATKPVSYSADTQARQRMGTDESSIYDVSSKSRREV